MKLRFIGGPNLFDGSNLLFHKLKTCAVGNSMIRHLADTPPDLLLLDWRLYGSPATETCILLQKAYPRLSIVLLSVDAGDAEAAKRAGALFIYKGAPPEDMIATLKPLFRTKSLSRSSSESNLKLRGE